MSPLPADRLLKTAIAMTSSKNTGHLLELVLAEAMDYTRCDAGRTYLYSDRRLICRGLAVRSRQLFIPADSPGEEKDPALLSESPAAEKAAKEQTILRLDDLYRCPSFDFRSEKAFDLALGYQSSSLLLVPICGQNRQCLGLLELINRLDGDGFIVPFSPEDESFVSSLCSLAGVNLLGNHLQKALYDMLHSFVAVMVDAIDARSPYNARHTRSMVHYAENFIRWLDDTDSPWKISEEEKDPFLMSIWLHDLGKLVIPLEIMDKPTRLGRLAEPVMHRIKTALLMEKIRVLEEPSLREESERAKERILLAQGTICSANEADLISDALYADVLALKGLTVFDESMKRIPLLTGEEFEALCVRKGTLTNSERLEMQRHVIYTSRLLSNMRFSGVYEHVPDWAGAHHEFLDGSGYPGHRKADELPPFVRLMTILDIFDALTADDRPYKPPYSPETAFLILEQMAREGKLDGGILALFKESGAWSSP